MRPPRSPLAFALLAAVLSLALPGSARALTVALDTPRVHADTVWVDVHLSELFNNRIEESLSRGMPATLELHAELWHKRSAWFDRLEDAVDAELRIRYEVWNQAYRLERLGAPPASFGSFDSLATALSRPLALPVGRVRGEERGRVHFVAVTATLRPLSVEDVAEVESWLSGEVESKRGSGFGLVTQVPRALFDAVRNFAGFGDDRGHAISPEFSLPDR
jgi:hypothetical protein